MKSKAISPMIATILLIAFTVAIGGIISVWLATYTRTAQTAVTGATEAQIKCAGISPNIYRVTNTTVFLLNSGTVELTNVTCVTQDGKSIGTITSMPPGNMSSLTWNSTGNTSVICSGICLGIGVASQCSVGDSCWVTG
jgi:flagellin-like protein